MTAGAVVVRALCALPIAFALAAAEFGCSPEVPANPTYTNDVQPIFMAHCVRCHGANDTLNSFLVAGTTKPPSFCYLQRYDDEGDCSSLSNPGCKPGAGYSVCTGMTPLRIAIEPDVSTRMPPAPSEPLNDWEKEVIQRWAAKGAPK